LFSTCCPLVICFPLVFHLSCSRANSVRRDIRSYKTGMTAPGAPSGSHSTIICFILPAQKHAPFGAITLTNCTALRRQQHANGRHPTRARRAALG
jgi:hypothetical protein